MTRSSFDVSLLLQRLGFVAVLLLLWQLVIWSGVLPSMTPGVVEITAALWNAVISPSFWVSIGQTTLAAMSGWGISIVLGVGLGLIIGTIPFLDRSTTILIDFFRAFPVLALMPVVIMLLGQTTQMKIVVVILSALWPILVQTIYGARRQEQAVADMTRVFRISPWLKFRRVLLPAAMPFIATGVRISASISILVAVGVEVLSLTTGLGRDITLAQQAQHWDRAFAYIIFAGVVGWTVATVLQRLEKNLLKWNRQASD